MIWNLSNGTRYSAVATLASDKAGHDVWLTVVKATFDIAADGRTTPADEQQPVVHAPIYRGDPTRSSLLSESDIDPEKCGVDVLLQGSAQPGRGRSVREGIVSLEIDGRRKDLRVHGRRHWVRRSAGVVLSSADPYTELPMVYERTYGGWDPAGDGDHHAVNPAGCGYAKRVESLVDREAPGIEYADGAPRDTAAGFGPVARHWQPRRRLAGTYDAAWTHDRFPLPPADFDERFYSAAPADQQFARLPPQAAVRIVGMTRDDGLVFRLPRLALGIDLHTDRSSQHRRPALRSVVVLTDRRQVVVTCVDAVRCTGWKYRILDAEVIEKRFIA